MGKILENMSKFDFLQDDWNKKIHLLGIAIKNNKNEEIAFIVLKSHDKIYGLLIDSKKIDLVYDSAINSTNISLNNFSSIKDLEKQINNVNAIEYFIPKSSDIIITENENYLMIGPITIYNNKLDNSYSIYSSIITIDYLKMNAVEEDKFHQNIYDKFPLENLLNIDNNNLSIKNEDYER